MTLAELQPLADEKSLRISVNFDLNDAMVVNDEHRLRQILVKPAV